MTNHESKVTMVIRDVHILLNLEKNNAIKFSQINFPKLPVEALSETETIVLMS